ncbi:MAG: hypothetical protein V1833_01845 [Elusimicrobiota bacterium]
MSINQFVKQVLLSCAEFQWIQKIERQQIKNRIRLRLYIERNFVDVYYNAEKKVISYAYIECGKRIFGANNMRIGWHIHPYKNEETHRKTNTISIKQFLKLLEKHLKGEHKI